MTYGGLPIDGENLSPEKLNSAFGGPNWANMSLVADDSVGEKALSAREWLSQSSAAQQQQLQLPVSSMRKSASRVKAGALSQEKTDVSILLCGKNSAQEGSVDIDCHPPDIRAINGNDTREEWGGIPPLTSTFSPLIKSESSRSSRSEKREEGIPPVMSTCSPLIKSKSLKFSSAEKRESGIPPLTSTSSPLPKSKGSKFSSDEKREGGIPPLTSTSSPLPKSKGSKSSSDEKGEDGIPLLTSTCSPLIKSKSSKSSSNQGSLPGLVVAPDGVTLVKDRRKCKPRGILTVGRAMSSFDSDGMEEEVALPLPSPSVATVKWVAESWDDILSPGQSHTDEVHLSGSSVNSKSVRSPRIASHFDLPVDSTNGLGKEASEASSGIRGAVEFRPKFVPSVQESYDVRESVEGSPADVIFAHEDVSCRPEVVQKLSFSDRTCSAPPSPSNQQQHLESSKVISFAKQTAVSALDYLVSESQALDIRLSLDLERQADVSGSHDLIGSDGPCDYSSDVIPHEHFETISSTVEEDDGINLGTAETESRETEFLGRLPICPIPIGDCDFSHEQSETVSVILRNDLNPSGNPEKMSREIEFVGPSSVSPALLEAPLESEGTGTEVVPTGNFTDLAHVRDLHIIKLTHGEGSETHQAEFSQRLHHHADNQLSAQVLVAETLFELAAENLRKTRTAAELLNSPGEMRSRLEAVSSLSIVKLPVSSIESSSIDEHTALTAAPFALSSRVPRQISPRQNGATTDVTGPLTRIILSTESDFSQRVQSVNTLNRTGRVEVHELEVQALPATTTRAVDEEGKSTDQSCLAPSRNAQRQPKQGSSGNYKPSFRRPPRRRFSLCSKRVGLGSFLAAAAAFGFVVVSLAMGSCHHCYTRDTNDYYIRPT